MPSLHPASYPLSQGTPPAPQGGARVVRTEPKWPLKLGGGGGDCFAVDRALPGQSRRDRTILRKESLLSLTSTRSTHHFQPPCSSRTYLAAVPTSHGLCRDRTREKREGERHEPKTPFEKRSEGNDDSNQKISPITIFVYSMCLTTARCHRSVLSATNSIVGTGNSESPALHPAFRLLSRS